MGRKKKTQFKENEIVFNIYNNKRYIVISERDGLVKAKDVDNNTCVMIAADLKK